MGVLMLVDLCTFRYFWELPDWGGYLTSGRFDACGNVHFWVHLETALQGGVFDKGAFYRLWRCALFGTFGNCLTGGGI